MLLSGLTLWLWQQRWDVKRCSLAQPEGFLPLPLLRQHTLQLLQKPPVSPVSACAVYVARITSAFTMHGLQPCFMFAEAVLVLLCTSSWWLVIQQLAFQLHAFCGSMRWGAFFLQEKQHQDSFVSTFLEGLLRLLCKKSSFFAQGNVCKTVPFVVRMFVPVVAPH